MTNASWQFRDAEPAITDLVKKYGADRVWSTGLEIFGYPPTWQVHLPDYLALVATLEGN